MGVEEGRKTEKEEEGRMSGWLIDKEARVSTGEIGGVRWSRGS